MNTLAFLTIFLALINRCSHVESAENGTQLKESLKALDSCVIQSVVSFVYPQAYPPTSVESLKVWCKSHNDAFKCIKEKLKSTPALIKRGMATLVQSMQRLTRKYCTNVNSGISRGFVNDFRCIMEKRLPHYLKTDIEIMNSMHELVRRNYNDSATELKYLCCTLIKYRKSLAEVGEECAKSKATMQELSGAMISNELELICEDEEKLVNKVCPTLEPLQVNKTSNSEFLGAPSAALYLVATLGEPDEDSNLRSSKRLKN